MHTVDKQWADPVQGTQNRQPFFPTGLLVVQLVGRMGTKPEESTLRFSDCTEICMTVEGTDTCLHRYGTAEAGNFRHTIFP